MHWRLTAATFFCDKVKNWVPIMVYGDRRTHCGYFHRHRIVAKEMARIPACHGPEACPLCEAYKEDIFSRHEETPAR